MLVTADWVLPIASPPLRDAGVLVRDDVIVEVGPAAGLIAAHPDEPVEALPGCALVPGLVNAHTHLALSAMEALIPPMPFEQWVPLLVRGMRSWAHEDFEASAELGMLQCLEAGVTVVGDIAYGSESAEAALEAGIGGVLFWEVLGIEAEELTARLAASSFPPEEPDEWQPRLRRGISPHAPYSSGPRLLAATAGFARSRRLPFAIHAAESPAETELLLAGTGALAGVASRLARGFETPHCTTLPYLDRLGALDQAILVHLSQAHLVEDIALVAAEAHGAVLCPRSNIHLHNGEPPVAALAETGVPLAVGTDSSASNEDLDLMEELRALARLAPSLSPERLLRLVTLEGALVLGLSEVFGSIEPGKQADIAAFRLGPSDDPVASLVETAGRDTLSAVLSAGRWRIREGRHSLSSAAIRQRAAASSARASAAIGEP